MTPPLNEPWKDAWVEDLVQFDEALRLGRVPDGSAPVDPEFVQTQRFLVRLHTLWPRRPTKIGPYTLVNNLGPGAIGPCYLVEEPVTLRKMVLKVLWPDLSAHIQTRQHFVQEAQMAQRLQAPGLAAVYEVNDRGPLCSVLSEYCTGMSLAQWRRQRPQPLDGEVASGLVMRLANLLVAAHAHGTSHGNLKPSNIFLSLGAAARGVEITPTNLHDATVRIGDFGLAKAVQQTRLQSQGGLPWPMPQYLAPEQLQHRTRPTKPASDIYALGVLWYDLLTGRCPVKGATRAEILSQTRRVSPPPPRQYRPEIPAEVETLVLRCLHKDPRARPQSAEQLLGAMQAIMPVVAKVSPKWWKQWLGWK